MEKEGRSDSTVFLVLLVLITLPLISISGCTGDPDEEDPWVKFTLRIMSVTNRTLGSSTIWDAHIWIENKDPMDSDAPWADIKVKVTKDDDTLFVRTKPTRYFNSPGSGPQVWYEEMSGDPKTADIIDGFYITGIDEEYEGSVFVVDFKNLWAGEVHLPDEFT